MNDLTAALRRAGVTDVRDDTTTRAAYSTDASLYRVPPRVVVFPRDAGEVAATYTVAADLQVPLTARGAGTSVAGNAIGPGVVLDFSRHMNQVLGIDPDAATAVVQPGVVQARLQEATGPHGLRFGPDPSTSTRCTIGGMIGNNACGARTLGYGRTVDNIARLRGFFGTGTPFDLEAAPPGGRDPAPGTLVRAEDRALHELAQRELGMIRTSFGRFGRQVSGYAMEHLLPERGFDLARFLVGSEGTLAVITEATVRLVRDPAHRVMVVLGFDDIAAAADACPAVLRHGPSACEGLDARLVDAVRSRRAVPDLPGGGAWLFTEVSGDNPGRVLGRARAMAADQGLGAAGARVIDSDAQAAALWRIRADGAGLAGRAPSGRPAYAGWEDAAVPPESLGDYLRDFEALLGQFGLSAFPYGHFADGCVHVRLDLPLDRGDGPSVFRAFLDKAATLVARYGGSLSGEHGDGRARSGLLPRMYPPRVLRAFDQVKGICDPHGLLNPGVLVDPAPVDANLRFPAPAVPAGELGFAWAKDGGNLSQAAHRCTGVGKCRADNTAEGGVMCPSYLATGEEKDSTRGRARVLQEMIDGTLVGGGWRAPQVHEALDLCLSCKGCKSDCPTGTDMAAMKSEVLYQSYKGRVRPRSHYLLGRLPMWVTLASHTPRLAGAMLRVGNRLPWAKAAAGVDPRRSLPELAPRTFRHWAAQHQVPVFDPARVGGNQVLLMVDTFTNHFSPQVGRATLSVLRAAGYDPVITARPGCCGLTWITTGQLDAAKRILRSTVTDLAAAARAGLPIVGIEPSCTAVLRDDATELLADEDATTVAAATVTLAELLTSTPGWAPPSLAGRRIIAQPHCHHHAVMGWSPDAQLLRAAGAQLTQLGGCCGLAGNFGVELGHYDISVKIAEHDLLPAVRAAGGNDVILADGFSCRTQLADLTDRHGIHLAQLLDQAADATPRAPGHRSPAGSATGG